MSGELEVGDIVAALKAAAEPTRLRILLLLASRALNVKELTRVLGQSQPRISRHLRLLDEAELITRRREGSWVCCQIGEGAGGELARTLVHAVDPSDPIFTRDRERVEALERERELAVQAYFREHAAAWDDIRALYVAEANVEAAIREALGERTFGLLVDLGTGTGRMLELLGDRYERGIGIDLNQSMLGFARAKLGRAGLAHAQVRHGDICNLNLDDGSADVVVMHQVLHFLRDPGRALAEAARILAPGGRLVIVDFAPHDLDVLREQFAHERLGFSQSQVWQWLADAGLVVTHTRELKSASGAESGKLTVLLWLARRPATSRPETTANQVTREPVRSLT
jgi:ubiquinone/menaquinone biosynthesis C-methylase UbiE